MLDAVIDETRPDVTDFEDKAITGLLFLVINFSALRQERNPR